MEWLKDEYCRKLFGKEILKMWKSWTVDFTLIIVISYCIYFFVANNANETEEVIQMCLSIIIGIILPILISILIPLLFNHKDTLMKNFYWSEKQAHIYRDILEIITRIVDSLNRSMGIIPDFPELRGFYDISEANTNIKKVEVSALERYKKLHESIAEETNFNKGIYNADNIDEQITNLSIIYMPILLNHCTDKTVILYFSILLTNLIKLKENIFLFDNERYWTRAKIDTFNQIRNISDEILPLYNRIFPIVNAEYERNKNQNNLELYAEVMFENIEGVTDNAN